MPVVSTFFGIVIRLYHADHAPPHFHAAYGGYEAIIDISSGKVIGGRLPPRAKSLVEEWRKKRLSEIMRAWNNAAQLKPPQKITPLE
jgi:hypothetical protein